LAAMFLKTTGPVLTVPPAVIGRCAESNRALNTPPEAIPPVPLGFPDCGVCARPMASKKKSALAEKSALRCRATNLPFRNEILRLLAKL
jgi:hypothetical protein